MYIYFVVLTTWCFIDLIAPTDSTFASNFSARTINHIATITAAATAAVAAPYTSYTDNSAAVASAASVLQVTASQQPNDTIRGTCSMTL
jgi:hypothetical protein